MWQDLSLFLWLLIPGLLVGAVIGLLLRRYGTAWCRRYAQWTAALPAWAYACFTVFFVMLAASQFTIGRPTFGTGFAVFAVVELVAMANAFLRRVPPDAPK
jgi:NhaP-type Na+/H+ or K+/H+ antiporter